MCHLLDVVPILTSTVIQCSRAGMNESAYEYASLLCSQHRDSMDVKYKRKIEQIVRFAFSCIIAHLIFIAGEKKTVKPRRFLPLAHSAKFLFLRRNLNVLRVRT